MAIRSKPTRKVGSGGEAPRRTRLSTTFPSPATWPSKTSPFMVSEEELVITLYPQLIISGRVTDAETGELLPEFHIQYATLREVDRPIFWRGNLLCKAGSYTFRTGYLVKGWQVQAVAPGYLPEASRVFDSTEGQQTWDFQLKRGSGPEGTVFLSNGEPAAGVQVALARRGKEVGLRKGRLYIASRGAFLVEADGEGRFSFPAFQEEEFLIVAAGEAGYVEVTSEEFASSKRCRLKPWGRLEGMFKVGNRPGAGYTFQFHPSARNATDGFVSQYGCTATTDDEGRFEIEHVVPGPGTLSLVMIKHFQSGSTSCYYSRTETRRDHRGRDNPGCDRRDRATGEGPIRTGLEAGDADRLDDKRSGGDRNVG